MPVTAQEIIYKSLRTMGVLASGEAPTAAEAQDALYSLNSLIDSYAADPQYYYYTDDLIYTLVSSQAFYAIGNTSVSPTSITRSTSTATVTTPNPHGLVTGNRVTVSGASQTEYNVTASITVTGAYTFTYTVSGSPATPATGTPVYTTADFYGVRPIRVVGAFTRSGSTDTPIGIITEQFWNNIADKTTAGTPTKLLYRPASPFGQVILYPVPSSGLSLHLRTENMITQYAALTSTQYLPPGYQRLLELSLAVALTSEYGTKVAPENVAYLRDTLNQVMRTNLGKLPSSKIGAIPNSNIYSDTTVAGSQALMGPMPGG